MANKPKKARKPRAAKAQAEPKPEAQATSSPASGAASVNLPNKAKLPSSDQVKKLVKSLVSMGNEVRATSQAIGEKVSKAVENQHFDKKALGIAKSLYQMSVNRPEAFAITLPHLLAYIDDLELAKVASDPENQGMGMHEDDEGDDAEADDTDPAEQPAGGKSPGLTVVPGANAPTTASDVPSAPADGETEQAA